MTFDLGLPITLTIASTSIGGNAARPFPLGSRITCGLRVFAR